ncbi:MAG: sigma-70 family RNA polymerase sigma factor [Leptospirales bacterium]|nr:sigma-70 family RNA polymerase sigma factor [Leptospirales bacterium]
MESEAVPDIAELYRTHRRALCSRLTQMCGDADLAEELTQDAFLAARRYLHTFRPEKGDARSWIFAIGANLVRRRQQRTAGRESVGLDIEPADMRPNFGEAAERRERDQAIGEALESLPEPDRSLLRWKYYENLSLKECAERLTMPPSTAARRFADALKRMRAALQSKGFEFEGGL